MEKKKDASSAPRAAQPADAPPPPPPPAQSMSREELANEARPAPVEAPGSPAPTATSRPSGAPKPTKAGGSGAATKSAPQMRHPIDSADPFDPSSGWQRPPPRLPPPAPSAAPRDSAFEEEDDFPDQGVAPYEGRFAEVMDKLQRKSPGDALALASKWRDEDPGDALALVGLGEVYEASGEPLQAARAFGSIIDLFPGRADLRRFAGARLERIAKGADPVSWLVVDTYKKAVASRPDHPSGHRMLAYALARAGHFEEAFEAIVAGFVRRYPSGRFAGVRRVLADDVGILAAALIKARPERKAEIQAKLREMGVSLSTKPSLRFVLSWETDANDVDFHIRDGRRGHAYFRKKRLRSGGELFADVTTGYGPECFSIEGSGRAYPYRLQAHYYSKGPMGYGMGKLQILEHDGAGGIKMEERPFVVMTDRAFVDLGVVTGPLK